MIAASVPGAISTARLAFASSAFTVVAVLAIVLGPLADYEGRKKRFFAAFFGLGVGATCLLAFAPAGQELAVLAVFGLSAIGFAAANVFYDSFLTDITSPERMDRLSAAGYAWGYVGSTTPFVLSLVLVNLGPAIGLVSQTTAVCASRSSSRLAGGRCSRCRCCVACARCTSFGRRPARRSWPPCATARGGWRP